MPVYSCPNPSTPPRPRGFRLIDNVIPPALEQDLVNWIDRQPWNDKLKRRTQHYGYEYKYSSRNTSPATPMGGPILQVAQWLHQLGIMTPDQCIVNEYTHKQGIGSHADAPVFGPTVVSISLLMPTNMRFTPVPHLGQGTPFTITLMPRSLLVLADEARYYWEHEIAGTRKTVSLPDGQSFNKDTSYRRVSITYRTRVQSTQ